MTAEILREAAALMRTRADAAVAGPWATEERERGRVRIGEGRVYSTSVRSTAEFADEVADTLDMADASHIASWHPTVALAVAMLLDNEANAIESADEGRVAMGYNNARRSLLADIARAYLGNPAGGAR